MTLDQIAEAMGVTQDDLRLPGAAFFDERREFVARAFAARHKPEAIGDYLDRSQTMVLHALRMTCVNEMGAPYGQTLAEMKYRLTGEAA